MLVKPSDSDEGQVRRAADYIDGFGLLTRSPFRSAAFLTTSFAGLCCIGADTHVVYQHGGSSGMQSVLTLCLLLGVQVVYQWWGALRCLNRMRGLFSEAHMEAAAGSPLLIALRVAAGGMLSLLFFCYCMVLLELVIVGALISRFDSLK